MLIKVLLLDDDIRVFNKLQGEVLVNNDDFTFFLRYAKTKKEVFQILRDRNNDFYPDICLFDINLNSKEDGIDIAAIVLKKHQFPIIFLTNHPDEFYWDKVSQIGIPPSHFVAKGITEDNKFTIKNKKHFLELIENTIINSRTKIDFLLFSNKKIGIPTLNGNKPIKYDFYRKEEILYIIGKDGVGYIYVTGRFTKKGELEPYSFSTSGARIYKQLQRFYDCFLACGRRDSIIFNAEKIKSIEHGGDYTSLTFEDGLKLVTPPNTDLESIISNIKKKLKNENMLLGTRPK